MNNTKQCTGCFEVKSLDEFEVDKRKLSGGVDNMKKAAKLNVPFQSSSLSGPIRHHRRHQ